jgi:hypothetical protein
MAASFVAKASRISRQRVEVFVGSPIAMKKVGGPDSQAANPLILNSSMELEHAPTRDTSMP